MKTKPNIEQYTLMNSSALSFSDKVQTLAEPTIDVSQWTRSSERFTR